jgi:hypothetical protein
MRLPDYPWASADPSRKGHTAQQSERHNNPGSAGARLPDMASLPRTQCPVCGRDVAISLQGRTWRHDPASGRTPELKSCPGSLKPVTPPVGELLLFVSPEAVPEPAGLF